MIKERLEEEKQILEKELDGTIQRLKAYSISNKEKEELLKRNAEIRYQRGYVRYLISLCAYEPKFSVKAEA